MGQQLSFDLASSPLFLCPTLEEFKESFFLEFPNVLVEAAFLRILCRTRTSLWVLFWDSRGHQQRVLRVYPRARLYHVPLANLDASMPTLTLATLLLGPDAPIDYFSTQELRMKHELARSARLLGHSFLAPFWLPCDVVLFSDTSICTSRPYVGTSLDKVDRQHLPLILKDWWAFQIFIGFIQLHACGLTCGHFTADACLLVHNKFGVTLTDSVSEVPLHSIPRESAAIALDLFLTKTEVETHPSLIPSVSTNSTGELAPPECDHLLPSPNLLTEVSLPPERFKSIAVHQATLTRDLSDLTPPKEHTVPSQLIVTDSPPLLYDDSRLPESYRSEQGSEIEEPNPYGPLLPVSSMSAPESGSYRGTDEESLKEPDDLAVTDDCAESIDFRIACQGDSFSLGCVIAKIYLPYQTSVFGLTDILSLLTPPSVPGDASSLWDCRLPARVAALLENLPLSVKSLLAKQCFLSDPAKRGMPQDILRQALESGWFAKQFQSVYLPLRILKSLPFFQSPEVMALNLSLNFPVIIHEELLQRSPDQASRLRLWFSRAINNIKDERIDPFRHWLADLTSVMTDRELAMDSPELVFFKFAHFRDVADRGLVELWNIDKMERFAAEMLEFWSAATAADKQPVPNCEALEHFASLMSLAIWEDLFEASPPELLPKLWQEAPSSAVPPPNLLLPVLQEDPNFLSSPQPPLDHLVLMTALTVDCILQGSVEAQVVLIRLLLHSLPWIPSEALNEDIIPLCLHRVNAGLSKGLDKSTTQAHVIDHEYLQLLIASFIVLASRSASEKSRIFALTEQLLNYYKQLFAEAREDSTAPPVTPPDKLESVKCVAIRLLHILLGQLVKIEQEHAEALISLESISELVVWIIESCMRTEECVSVQAIVVEHLYLLYPFLHRQHYTQVLVPFTIHYLNQLLLSHAETKRPIALIATLISQILQCERASIEMRLDESIDQHVRTISDFLLPSLEQAGRIHVTVGVTVLNGLSDLLNVAMEMADKENCLNKSVKFLDFCSSSLRLLLQIKRAFGLESKNILKLRALFQEHLTPVELNHVMKLAAEATEILEISSPDKQSNQALLQILNGVGVVSTDGQTWERDSRLYCVLQEERSILEKLRGKESQQLSVREFTDVGEFNPARWIMPHLLPAIDLTGWHPLGSLFASLKPNVFADSSPVNLKLTAFMCSRYLVAYSTSSNPSFTVWSVPLLRSYGASPATLRWRSLPADLTFLSPVDDDSCLMFAGLRSGELRVYDFSQCIMAESCQTSPTAGGAVANKPDPECVYSIPSPSIQDLADNLDFGSDDLDLVSVHYLPRTCRLFTLRTCGLMILYQCSIGPEECAETKPMTHAATAGIIPVDMMGVPRACTVAEDETWAAVLTYDGAIILISMPLLNVVQVWKAAQKVWVSAIAAVPKRNFGVDDDTVPHVLLATDSEITSQILLLDLIRGEVMCCFQPLNSHGHAQVPEEVHRFKSWSHSARRNKNDAFNERDRPSYRIPGTVLHLPRPVGSYITCFLSGNAAGELRSWSVSDPTCTAVITDSVVLWKEYRSSMSMWINQHRACQEKAFLDNFASDIGGDAGLIPSVTYEISHLGSHVACTEHPPPGDKIELQSHEPISDILILHPDLSNEAGTGLIPPEQPLIAVACYDGSIDLYV